MSSSGKLIQNLTDKQKIYLKEQVEIHQNETHSTIASSILNNWEEEIQNFVNVIPTLNI